MVNAALVLTYNFSLIKDKIAVIFFPSKGGKVNKCVVLCNILFCSGVDGRRERV
jgi:hypothetical protein